MPAIPSRLPLRVAAVAAVAALALVLAGCSGSSTSSDPNSSSSSSPKPEANPLKSCTTAGDASNGVKVTGDFGSNPTVSVGSVAKLSSTQRTVVTPGAGEKARSGSVVKASLALYNASTQKIAAAYEPPAYISVSVTSVITGLAKALNCAQKGERVVAVIPPAEGFGSAGSAGLGIGAKDVMVFVIDVIDIVPTKASGVAQKPPAGLPTVALAADGKPAVNIPSGFAAPATTQIATLIKGAGDTVAATDTVIIQYQGTNLRTGKIFDQTWGRDPYTGAANGFVPGFNKALLGQTVGSQVLALIPAADGYGAGGQSSAGITGTDTMIFVIDILATTPAAVG